MFRRRHAACSVPAIPFLLYFYEKSLSIPCRKLTVSSCCGYIFDRNILACKSSLLVSNVYGDIHCFGYLSSIFRVMRLRSPAYGSCALHHTRSTAAAGVGIASSIPVHSGLVLYRRVSSSGNLRHSATRRRRFLPASAIGQSVPPRLCSSPFHVSSAGPTGYG